MKTKANPAMKTVYKFVSTGLGLRTHTDLFLSMTRLLNIPDPMCRDDSEATVLFPKTLSALRII